MDCYEHLVDEAILEAHGFIITCPAQDANLSAIEKVHRKIANKNKGPGQGKKSPIAIAITKNDCIFDPFDRSIDNARAWAKREECGFHITSAKDGDGIQDPFMSVLRALVKSDRPVARLMGWI